MRLGATAPGARKTRKPGESAQAESTQRLFPRNLRGKKSAKQKEKLRIFPHWCYWFVRFASSKNSWSRRYAERIWGEFFIFGPANSRKIAGEFLSEFWWRILIANFSALFFPGFQATQKIHAQTSRPELSACLSNFTFLNPKFIHGDFLLTGETKNSAAILGKPSLNLFLQYVARRGFSS